MIWVANSQPRSEEWMGQSQREGAAYQSKTTGNGSPQETSRDGIVESSRVWNGGGRSRTRNGAVGSGKQDVSTGRQSLQRLVSSGGSSNNVPVGGVLSSSRGHEGSESEGDKLELHCD